jgi:hypothetical protein
LAFIEMFSQFLQRTVPFLTDLLIWAGRFSLAFAAGA